MTMPDETAIRTAVATGVARVFGYRPYAVPAYSRDTHSRLVREITDLVLRTMHGEPFPDDE